MTYTGLISFAVRLSSVFTGIIFTLIVTRELSQDEFGTWSLIGGLLLYVVTIDFVISYWVTREIARDIESGRTAIISGMVLSIGGVLAYLLIVYLVGMGTDANQDILYFATILIPVMFVNDIIHYMNAGWKPQIVSYGFFVSEITKVPAALILVYLLQMGLHGAILATFISYIASILLHVVYGRKKLRSSFQKKFLKKWFKLSWLPLYQSIPNVAFVSDVVIFSIMTGSVIGAAYMTAARTISNVVMHASVISDAIYPKLLGGGREEHLQENLIKMLYFSIPLLCLTIVLSRPGLFALNPAYENAYIIVVITSLRSFLSILNRMFHSALQGIEKIDLDENATFKRYVKSKLFFMPTLRVLQYCSYAIILIIGLFIIKGYDFLDLVTYWAVTSLIIEIPFIFILYYMVKKNVIFKMDKIAIAKYVFTSLLSFGILYLLTEKFLNYKISIFQFLPDLLMFTGVGIFLYLGITYATDNKTRQLFSAIISEFRHKRVD